MLIIDLVARLFWFPFKPFRRYLPPSPPSSAPTCKPITPHHKPNSPSINKPDSSTVTIKPSKMYIYTGKFTGDYGSAQAKDETFIIILPNGHVSKDDVAYVFFQWTKNGYGQENVNWFQTFPIEDLKKTGSSDEFKLNHHKFNWEIIALDGYQTLKVDMRGPGGVKKPVKITLERVWDSESHGGKANDIPLVWTGKVNYQDSAKDEMAMFVVPEGFGAGRSVVALWQWYRYDLPKNDPRIVCYEPTDKPPPRVSFVQYGTQNIEHESDEGVKFSFKHDYEVFASWTQGNGKLALRLKEPDSKTPQNLGELSLSGRFDRNSFGFHPPESKPEHLKLDVRLPQPQPSLPRITGKMPFPETLTETLAHTAAFVDQAGYLAKYAEEQFNALNAKYGLRGQQLGALKSKSEGLEKSIKQKEADLAAEKKKLEELTNTLNAAQAAATKRETELQKKIDDALAALAKASTHDKADHAAIEELKKKIEAERKTLNAKISTLQQQLNDAKTELASKESLLESARKEARTLNTTIIVLKGKLEASNKERDDLKKKVRDLEAYKRNAENALDDAKKAFDAAQAELKTEKKRFDALAKELTDEIALKDKAISDLKASETAVKNLEEKIAQDEEYHKKDKEWHEKDNKFHEKDRKRASKIQPFHAH
ncbi:hypothetical protein CPAR01_05852 [Colletotrichum paranaense]|uniref:Hard-surface inducible protein n=1 Tax=Colletotrichum paranaense TaxID=1914294 RepID=A0ABQ9ST23_9PEZI|nr:uncharacterized protein CPAR01_05852 [Colletotrichum paranaense]KAK1542465.1 hypothetical protein CPAR01_05852 [Colletotrichum paranaense]